MDERQKKYVAAMREIQRSMDAHFSQLFAKLARERAKIEPAANALHARDCNALDPDSSLECNCGFEIRLRR